MNKESRQKPVVTGKIVPPGKFKEVPTKEKKEPNILPYIIAFALLTLAALGVLTWVLGEWYKSHQCITNPNIWCSDTWQCNNNCTELTDPAIDVDRCFVNAIGATGLASCIYGPNSAIATRCFSFGETGGTGSEDQTLCACVLPTGQSSNNCFAGCPSNLGGVASGANCCCCPGSGECQYATIAALRDATGTICGPDIPSIQKSCPNAPTG